MISEIKRDTGKKTVSFSYPLQSMPH